MVRAPQPVHGKTSPVFHDNTDIFKGLPNPFTATRYHSLIVQQATLPSALVPTARTEDGIIMGLRHAELPIYGVQFHPESIATSNGHDILRNFLHLAGVKVPVAA